MDWLGRMVDLIRGPIGSHRDESGNCQSSREPPAWQPTACHEEETREPEGRQNDSSQEQYAGSRAVVCMRESSEHISKHWER